MKYDNMENILHITYNISHIALLILLIEVCVGVLFVWYGGAICFKVRTCIHTENISFCEFEAFLQCPIKILQRKKRNNIRLFLVSSSSQSHLNSNFRLLKWLLFSILVWRLPVFQLHATHSKLNIFPILKIMCMPLHACVLVNCLHNKIFQRF